MGQTYYLISYWADGKYFNAIAVDMVWHIEATEEGAVFLSAVPVPQEMAWRLVISGRVKNVNVPLLHHPSIEAEVEAAIEGIKPWATKEARGEQLTKAEYEECMAYIKQLNLSIVSYRRFNERYAAFMEMEKSSS